MNDTIAATGPAVFCCVAAANEFVIPPTQTHSHQYRKEEHCEKQNSDCYRSLVRHRRGHGGAARDGGIRKDLRLDALTASLPRTPILER